MVIESCELNVPENHFTPKTFNIIYRRIIILNIYFKFQ